MIPLIETTIVRNDFRASKRQTNNRLVALFVLLLILGLLMFSDVSATTIFQDNFDTYDLGKLDTQGGWIKTSGVYPDVWWVVNDMKFQGVKSAYSGFEIDVGVQKTGNTIPQGKISFYFRYSGKSETDYFVAGIFELGYSQFPISVRNGEFFYINGSGGVDLYGSVGELIWNYVEIEWDKSVRSIRFNVNNLGWTNWVYVSSPAYHFDIDTFFMVSFSQEIWVDRIQEFLPDYLCNFQNCNLCYNENECYLAGCNWNSETEFCEYKSYGVCGIEHYLGFCETQFECETFGGYWVADYCWETQPPTITNWENYYSDNSDFETPTALITSLVNLTQPVMEIAGGWLVALESIFDKAEATQKGEQFGEAIPIARGYLVNINDFFGGFPVSEAFVFFLVITLAVGVFRIVKSIIMLVKPF